VLQNSFAALLAKEHFVTDENISWTQLPALNLRDEALGLGKGAH